MMNAPTRKRRPDLMLISSVSVIALLLFWEAACRLQWVDPLFLPPPSSVYARMAGMWEQGSLMSHILASARRVMVGFAAATALAIPLGIFLGTSRAPARPSIRSCPSCGRCRR